jgi:tetratricopeptide (TPR) repeat protein
MIRKIGWFALGSLLAAVLVILIYQIPIVRFHFEWRIDAFSGIVRGWIRPSEVLPTPSSRRVKVEIPTFASPTISETSLPTTTLAATPTPLPERVILESPEWEKQDWNNCGPATLALGLRVFGWEGDQYSISDLLKPERGDKNVNIEELIFYVRNRAGWLNADFRVGGDIAMLRAFIAAGLPVIVEKGFILDPTDGGGGWAGHYLLLTGYEDQLQEFIVQDTNPGTGGPDRRISYTDLDEGWRQFNRVFMYIYLPEQQALVDELLGFHQDKDYNRSQAMQVAQDEISADSEEAYAWFNLGTNLIYFERYQDASQAFDVALSVGLPWRFTRYQFGPYIAYFNTSRFDDLYELADATLFRTEKAEESMLWRGWASYRLGDWVAAVEDFRSALRINPDYFDALYALEFVGATP